MPTTRSEFLKQLDEVQSYIDRLVEKTASDIRALNLALKGDEGAARGVIAGRKAERRLREAIESNCLDIMLLQQPLIAGDLRFVSGSFRVVSDLTHIDEMTRDVAYLAQTVPLEALDRMQPQFSKAAERVAVMVETAVKAFREQDAELAEQVFAMDDKIDAMYEEAEKAVVKLIREADGDAKYLPELLMVAKYFERMADDGERIANWAMFRVTGKHEVHSQQSVVEKSEAAGE